MAWIMEECQGAFSPSSCKMILIDFEESGSSSFPMKSSTRATGCSNIQHTITIRCKSIQHQESTLII